jgi:hypothetical protein
MDIAALALVLAAIFAWGIISAKAAAISTPIFFVAIGLIMAGGLKLVHLSPDPHSTKIIAEVTLVWVLFADASRVRLSDLREDLGHYVRLLAIGLPLTIVFGTAAGPSSSASARGTPCFWERLSPQLTRPLAPRSCQIAGCHIECGRHSTWKAD